MAPARGRTRSRSRQRTAPGCSSALHTSRWEPASCARLQRPARRATRRTGRLEVALMAIQQHMLRPAGRR
eukprot:350955-Chlamydomonas_euryale.AAC.6